MLARTVLSWLLVTLSIVSLLILDTFLNTPSATLRSMSTVVALWGTYVGLYVAAGMAALIPIGFLLRRAVSEFGTGAACLILIGAMLGGLAFWSANLMLGIVAGLFSATVWVWMNRRWLVRT